MGYVRDTESSSIKCPICLSPARQDSMLSRTLSRDSGNAELLRLVPQTGGITIHMDTSNDPSTAQAKEGVAVARQPGTECTMHVTSLFR